MISSIFIIDEKFASDFVNVKQKYKLLNENDFSTKTKQEILTIPHKQILRPFIDKCKTYKELVVVYSLWQETNFLNQYWLMPKVTEKDLTVFAEILDDDIVSTLTEANANGLEISNKLAEKNNEPVLETLDNSEITKTQ